MKIKTEDNHVSPMLPKWYEKLKSEITLTAILNSVYVAKTSSEAIQTKLTNQMNAMEASIHQINPKFYEKSKNSEKVKQQMMHLLTEYEANLKQFCQTKDNEINDLILKKVELETRLLMAIITKKYLTPKQKQQSKLVFKRKRKQKEEVQYSEEYKENLKFIQKLKKEIHQLNKKWNDLNEQKIKRVFEAMESGGKSLSTHIRKPRTIKKITRFFANRFNTYHVIVNSVLEPIGHRIDEFKVNELKKVILTQKEFDLSKIEQKIQEKQALVFHHIEHKRICKEMGIL